MTDGTGRRRNLSPSEVTQHNRRVNLDHLLRELESEGVESKALIDQLLGLPLGTIALIRKGEALPDKMAREIEWAMNRPAGWLDREPVESDI